MNEAVPASLIRVIFLDQRPPYSYNDQAVGPQQGQAPWQPNYQGQQPPQPQQYQPAAQYQPPHDRAQYNGPPTPRKKWSNKQLMMVAAVLVAGVVVSAGLLSFFAWDLGRNNTLAVDLPPTTSRSPVLPTGTYTQVASGTVTGAGGPSPQDRNAPQRMVVVPGAATREPIQFNVSYATVDTASVVGLPEGASIASKMIK